MTTDVQVIAQIPQTKRNAWKALETHYRRVRDLHLRDLFADDPLVFKKLIYEMRFDEASARYGDFGEFFSGVQFSIDQLSTYLDGKAVPALNTLQTA